MRLQNIREGVHDPHTFKAIFMVGAPGAGKTTIAKKIMSGTGLKSINVDDIYEWINHQEKIANHGFSSEIYAHSGNVLRRRIETYMNGRLGLVIDSTGRNISRMKSTKAHLESLGYDTVAVYVDVDLLVALDRNDERVRRAEPSWVRQVHKQLQQTRPAIQSLFGDDFVKIRNNSEQEFNEDFPAVEARLRRWLNSTPRHPEAQKWKLTHQELVEDDNSKMVLEAKHFADAIGKECAEWVRAVTNPFTTLAWRGTVNSLPKDQINYQREIKNRKPVDMSYRLHVGLTNMIKDAGLVADRTNSLFVSGDEVYTRRYGASFAVFPIGPFNYTWHSEAKDWWTHVNRQFFVKDNRSKIILDAMKSGLRGDDGSLIEAINSGHEIMLHAPGGYYLVSEPLLYYAENYHKLRS